MKKLLLLRHAKSSWDDASIPDHDRPLNRRGRQNAMEIGKYLKERKIIPEQIISSTANRAHETAKLVALNSGYRNRVKTSISLYEASFKDYVLLIQNIDDAYKIILIIGHNPILESILEKVTGELHVMKTCSLANIDLPLDNWKTFDVGVKGTLVDLVKAREL